MYCELRGCQVDIDLWDLERSSVSQSGGSLVGWYPSVIVGREFGRLVSLCHSRVGAWSAGIPLSQSGGSLVDWYPSGTVGCEHGRVASLCESLGMKSTLVTIIGYEVWYDDLNNEPAVFPYTNLIPFDRY